LEIRFRPCYLYQILTYLTSNQYFIQKLSSRGQNEVILVELES
jgi:hypothetical protein